MNKLISPRFHESRWSYSVIIAFPLLFSAVTFLYITSVDLSWLYGSKLSQTYDSSLSSMLLETQLRHGIFWHWGKTAFWPTILLFLKLIFIMTVTISVAQFFNTELSFKKLSLCALWSTSPTLISCFASLLHIGLSTHPLHFKIYDLDPLSWNSLLGISGNGPLQFFTAFESPLVFLEVALLAFQFHTLSNQTQSRSHTNTSIAQSILFALIPYALYIGTRFYIFGIALA